MSCVPVVLADDSDEACANCGKQGSVIVKLKKCTACRLVKYCGVDCQRAHRKQHKKACKQRAAEHKDKQLYSQGHERLDGDFCPICTLPIPIPMDEHSRMMACCMKRICFGCSLAARKRGMNDCPFCRTRKPDNDADCLAMVQARVTKQDPVAIMVLGDNYSFAKLGLQKDMRKAIELWTKAAELGSIEALFPLGVMYYEGEEVQEEAKGAEFFKRAAMRGHKVFMVGAATKEQYAEALKGHQDAVEDMKSHDRDEAKRFGTREQLTRRPWGPLPSGGLGSRGILVKRTWAEESNGRRGKPRSKRRFHLSSVSANKIVEES
ncbi:hypothetical protein THAOC_09797, partial [Thalassiosira oceanica]